MPKIDREISEEYGSFVKHSANSFTHYTEREVTTYRYSVEHQRLMNDYENKYHIWNEQFVKERMRKKQKKLPYRIFFYFVVPYLVWFYIAAIISSPDELIFTSNPIAEAFVFTLFTYFLIAISQPAGGAIINFIETELIPSDYITKEEYEKYNPSPKKPEGFPFAKIKEIEPDTKNRKDELYEIYLDKKKFYQTVASCPICNSTIKFSNARKVPFEDKCKECNYSFTFIYKKKTERYKTISYGQRGGTKKKSHYIEYDGIEPTRARSPSKSRNVSGTKRRSIPKDVKNDVWNRDGGKCVECGSKENLEFDHIIPVAKGGANTYRNLQLLCEDCNREKSDNIV